MIELHIDPKSGEDLVKGLADRFNLNIVDNGIRHIEEDRMFYVSNHQITSNMNVTFTKAKINHDVRVIRSPKKENHQTLITITNFNTSYNPDKPEFLVGTGHNYQISITNSVHANSIDVPKGKEVVFITFRINNDHLKDFESISDTAYKELLNEDKPFYMYHFLPYKTEKLIHKFFSFDGPKDWRRLMKISVLYEVLADIYMLLRASEPITRKDVNVTQMKQVLNMQSYILKYLNLDLTVEKLAQEFAMSESAIHKAFKKVLDTSPYHFIKKERLKRSRDLLLSSEQTISQIAFGLNFSSPSHFVSTFKKEFGMTPATMRQSHVLTAV